MPFNPEKCRALIDSVWQWDQLAMFHEPVKDSIVQGYSDIIKEPMDLTTIKGKLAEKIFESDTDVVNDLLLMVSNALRFNAKDTSWYAHAKALRAALPLMISTAGVEVNEEDLEYFDGRGDRDESSSIRRAERRGDEDMSTVLKGMNDDLQIPIEELRRRFSAIKRPREESEEGSSASDSSASDDSDDDGSDITDSEESDETSDSESDESSDSNSSTSTSS